MPDKPSLTPAAAPETKRGRTPRASPTQTAKPVRGAKTDTVIAMLSRPQGASIDELMAATSWQRHSVRGALAGAVRKKLGAAVTSEVADGVRRYRTSGFTTAGEGAA